MGKAANNERIKLRATWYNNLGIGLAVAAGFVPFFGLFQHSMERSVDGSKMSTEVILFSITLIAVAITTGLTFRQMADSIIQSLED